MLDLHFTQYFVKSWDFESFNSWGACAGSSTFVLQRPLLAAACMAEAGGSVTGIGAALWDLMARSGTAVPPLCGAASCARQPTAVDRAGHTSEAASLSTGFRVVSPCPQGLEQWLAEGLSSVNLC